ncbi:MAG: MBL fold metallo-hydrolase [Ignavibacteriae bacterium]|nr:MBL fold metallo-hydrolase [Ignavibacteria bacterium]MBI3364861.1 MBL fold metallo-hydrolase [Ignavibacteriota bacterium]
MHVRFWGTRGSISTPGKHTVRYGGNTPCVEVRLAKDELLILDAGTGIRNLGEQLMEHGESIKAHILISHPHWDHIQGFPFFNPAFISGNEFTIVGGETDRVNLQKMISDQMNKVYFPIQLNELKAKLNFHPIKEEEFTVFGAKVQTLYVNHPTFAIGYRISQGGKTLVYISDNEPFDRKVAQAIRNVDKIIVDKFLRANGDPNQRIFDFVHGADVLIHDATYTPEEYVDRVGWGHSHYLFTLKVAAEGAVKKLVLFHHDPAHGDDKVDDILRKCKNEIRMRRYGFECVAAAEGMEITI